MPIDYVDIDQLETYVNTYVIPNGNQEITGQIGNNSLNGCIQFIRESPLNWDKAAVYNQTSALTTTTAVSVFTGLAPSEVTFLDNIYNQHVFVNMTTFDIPFSGVLGYYALNGTFVDAIPANTAVTIYKASNDLWVQGAGGSGGGGGSVQKEPKTFIVGTTPNAPENGETTWTYQPFENSYVILFVNRGGPYDLEDAGDGGPYVTKLIGSTTLTIHNAQFNTGDILTYILITP